MQEEIDHVYRDQTKWAKMSIMSVAGTGKFSLDSLNRLILAPFGYNKY